jgi:hypothetical protein
VSGLYTSIYRKVHILNVVRVGRYKKAIRHLLENWEELLPEQRLYLLESLRRYAFITIKDDFESGFLRPQGFGSIAERFLLPDVGSAGRIVFSGREELEEKDKRGFRTIQDLVYFLRDKDETKLADMFQERIAKYFNAMKHNKADAQIKASMERRKKITQKREKEVSRLKEIETLLERERLRDKAF